MANITYKGNGPNGLFDQQGISVNFEIAGQKIKGALVRSKTMLKLVHVRSGQVIHEMPDLHSRLTRGHILAAFSERIKGREQTVLSVFRGASDINEVPKGFL